MNLPSTDSSLAQLKLLCIVVEDQVQSLEEVAETNAKKEHEKALNIALVKKLNELQSELQKTQKDIRDAMDEGNLLLNKICQPHLFCDDVLTQKDKVQSDMQSFISTFKMPYDSFSTYGQTAHQFQLQSARLEAEISNQTRNLQELQLVLLPRLQILLKCYLNIDALMVTQDMSTMDAMEEQVYQMQTENEVATLLLESWSLSMKTFLQDFKSVFDKFHSLLS